MPRFVLLRHECPTGFAKPSHWDFMLEANGTLLTWELHELPATWGGAGGTVVNATRLPDHRLQYLDCEGPLSGDRGTVQRVASGMYELLSQNEQSIRAKLDSSMFRGEIELIRLGNDWQLQVNDHDDA
jgi:hypothetical protein